jgi:hypothetical protein
MRKTVARRLLPLLTALATVLGLGVAAVPTAAHAAPDAAGVVFEGTATLPTFPCASASCTGGTFSSNLAEELNVCVNDSSCKGVTEQGVTLSACITTGGCSLSSSSFSYTESCLPGQTAGAPPLGTATGPVTVADGANTYISGTFSWIRVGLTAVITFTTSTPSGGTGAAVAAFVPTLPIGSCAPGGTVVNQSAVVVGIGGGIVA